MSLSVSEIGAVVDELTPRLEGARCQKIRGVLGEPETLTIDLSTRSESLCLLVSVRPGLSRIHLVESRPKAPPQPTGPIMGMRKHLHGRRVQGIAHDADDRIVVLQLIGGPSTHTLVCELTGRHGNVFLLDDDDTILCSLLPNRSKQRNLVPGEPYVRPATRPPKRGVREDWPRSDLSGWLERRYSALGDERTLEDARAGLASSMRKAVKALKRRHKAIQRDFDRLDDVDALRREGELLRGAYGAVQRGARSVSVVDYYDADQREVEIALDPKLDLQENIERRFHRVRRLERGAETMLERLEQTADELADAEAHLTKVESAETTAALDSLELRARKRRWIRTSRAAGGGGRRKAEKRLPYREFVSSDGIPIWVGRGGADNDATTFQHGRGNDLWLHAADWAGAHVIVRVGREDVPRSTLEEAARLAAHYSKGRNDSVVTVQYVRRKNVRKPKGLPPGRVLVSDARSIDIRRDEVALKSIFDASVVD